MKNKIKLSLIIFSLVVFIALSLNVNAIVGVTSYYFDDKALIVEPGEVVETQFELQNQGEGSDATVTVALTSGEEIAELTDTTLEYSVPLGTSRLPVPLRIIIPGTAKPGDGWQVGASFSVEESSTAEGAIALGATYHKSFKVIVEEPAPVVTPAAEEEAVPPVEEEAAVEERPTMIRVPTKGEKILKAVSNFIAPIIILILLFLVIKFAARKKKKP